MSFSRDKNNKNVALTRRGFLGASAGISALAITGNSALSETISSGYSSATISDIHGWGRDPGFADVGFNENPYGPSPRAVRVVNDSIMDVNRYDFGAYTKLENAIGEYLGLERNEDLSSGGNPLFGQGFYPVYAEGGSSFILDQITMIYGLEGGSGESIESEPGDGAVTRAAYSLRNRYGAEINIKRIPATKEFVHDLEAMKNAVTDKTTLLVITNPNNPTGTILSYQEIESFINGIPESVTIIIDEAYIHYAREENYVSGISLSQKYKNVIVTRTFSKMYGLAGLRIGYAVGDRSVMSELRAAGNGWGISNVSCYAAMAALKDKSFVRQVKRLTNETKDYFYGELDSLGLTYTPSHSNFILVNVNDDAREFQKKLMKRNVRVRAYDNDAIRNHIRVSVGTLDEMQATVNVLQDLLKT